MVFGAPLAKFVYHDAEVGRYVQILGFVAPFMYLESMVDGVLKGLGGAAGDVPLFAAGLDIAHHSHLVCCAEIWHDGVPGGDGGVEFDDVLLEYEEDDGANKKAFPRWGKVAEDRMRGRLAMIAR